MPNWCDNVVNISGDAKDIKTFKDKAFNKGVFHFNNLIPMPEGLDISSGFFGKWDINAQDIRDDNEFITLEFETAWGPPEGVFYHIKDNFPHLDISWFYNEPGMEMAGYLEG